MQYAQIGAPENGCHGGHAVVVLIVNALFPKGVGKNNAILGELCNSWLLTMRVHRKDARISSGIAHCQISEVALLPEMAVFLIGLGNNACQKTCRNSQNRIFRLSYPFTERAVPHEGRFHRHFAKASSRLSASRELIADPRGGKARLTKLA